MSFIKKLFGDPNARVVAQLEKEVQRINALEPEFVALSDDALREKTAFFKDRLKTGATLDELLPEAFAAVREAAKRKLNQRHYDVQLIGGMVLHRGEISEMKTGEGKTLMATLAAYLNALTGKGVHVVTVNDYLAKRDAVWMGQIFYALGMSTASIQHESAFLYDPHFTHEHASETEIEHDKERDTTGAFKVHADYLRPVSRREAYLADITYGTNNEYGFDYLRDNMVRSTNQMVQRDLHYAIVDEVDSILIDEARTPLIISAPAEESTDRYYQFATLIRQLVLNEDYNVDEKLRAASFTEAGQDKVTKALGHDPWTQLDAQTIYHLEAALKAHALYQKEREYVVKDNEVIIVDEFTGRLMFGRRYSEGLHQAIEAQEGVPIQRESKTLATVTFQNYFRLYQKLAGMTGTAVTEAEEFSKIYKLDVTTVPTNRPLAREDLTDRIYATEAGKYKAVAREIKERYEKGQPVLVGTISIEKNEYLSALLAREGVPHQLLNAKNHEKEAEIIAQAGRKGAVTVATNMAGRGVDIILGGNPPNATDAETVRTTGGLLVLGTERHESRRIDNQLRGRSGRQGDPGATQFYVSMEDDLMRIFGPERMKNLMQRMGLPEDTPIENVMVAKAIESAQRKVEGQNFDIRKHLLDYDDVLNKHRDVFYRNRREVLETAESPEPDVFRELAFSYVEAEIEQIVLFHTAGEREQDWNLDEVIETMRTMLPLTEASVDQIRALRREAGGKLADAEARTSIIETLMGIARASFAEQEKQMQDTDFMKEIAKSLILESMDVHWIEHLDNMHHLRTGIGLRSYGQRDPLVEYKRESYRLFNEFLAAIQHRIAMTLFKVSAAVRIAQPGLLETRGMQLSAPAKTGEQGAVATESTGAKQEKIGRNDPCPCGSGKMYKKCHGA
ncbi:MAG: preprotein translocase subunit SecA [bacterium]|nr:preprotein translocase subunit SecA [bacterium]